MSGLKAVRTVLARPPPSESYALAAIAVSGGHLQIGPAGTKALFNEVSHAG